MSSTLEIEKKFKLKAGIETWLPKTDYKKFTIFQTYFVENDIGKRIRYIQEENRMIVTIKKEIGYVDGVHVRLEKEYDIDTNRGFELFVGATESIIKKQRFVFPFTEDFDFEIDIFMNLKMPLTIAEVEMEEHQIKLFNSLEKPNWLGQEVTEDRNYTNYALLNLIDPQYKLDDLFLHRVL